MRRIKAISLGLSVFTLVTMTWGVVPSPYVQVQTFTTPPTIGPGGWTPARFPSAVFGQATFQGDFRLQQGVNSADYQTPNPGGPGLGDRLLHRQAVRVHRSDRQGQRRARQLPQRRIHDLRA